MVEPTWQRREFPVLKAVVEAMEEHPDREVRLQELVERSGLPGPEVDHAMWLLWRARPPYFEAYGVEDNTKLVAVTSLNERALRETGQWPDPESMVRSLIEALDRAAETEADPEKKGRLVRAAETLGGIGLQIAIAWAGGAIPR
jgi:hypothetical protein